MIMLRFATILLFVHHVFGEKYAVFNDTVNWYQALINCKAHNMELATIHSEQEQNELKAFLDNNKYVSWHWLGGTNEGNFDFYWAPTGTKMVYSKWLIGQPDNARYFRNDFELEKHHCVAWSLPTNTQDSSGWSDMSCKEIFPYICQKNNHCQIK